MCINKLPLLLSVVGVERPEEDDAEMPQDAVKWPFVGAGKKLA